MSELTISSLIKMILGIMVVVTLIGGVYYVFRYKIIDFFQGLSPEKPVELIFSILKSNL